MRNISRKTPKSCQDYTMIFFPITMTAIFFMLCAVAGTAVAPGCSPITMIHLLVPAFGESSSVCESLPFWGDPAGMTLTATSSLAIAMHWVFVYRLDRLGEKLKNSGLLTDDSGLSHAIEKYKNGRMSHKGSQLALFSSCGVAAFFFYVHTHDRSQVFEDLSARTGGRLPPEHFEENWWMNWDSHPAITFAWLLLAATGGFFAVKQGLIYIYLAKVIRKSNGGWKFHYVSALKDENYGWKPVGEIINIVYVGFLDFAFATGVMFYVMRSEKGAQWPQYLVLGVGLLGLIFNFLALCLLISFTVKRHRGVLDHEKGLVLGRVSGPAQGDLAAYWMSYGTHLHLAPQRYPMSSRIKPLVALLPGIFALYRIIDELFEGV
ncbi:hypothetical protein ACSCB1_15165 [Streptomyces europaeiscabiei]|uniref:hypothetical protein n=1 Tax=Streptomyces europaeiscabiei TaxID=146819 RepID=UPI00131A86AD|nr:hypothetical protein [Streptomyces europaeiscabiei]